MVFYRGFYRDFDRIYKINRDFDWIYKILYGILMVFIGILQGFWSDL